ncbi:MAG: CdaR family protein [Chloroflexota bacterium]|nr:CdaR family protein [Chloroflexota bacterium]
MNRIRSFLPILGRFITYTLGVRFLLALAISITLWILFTWEQNPVREDFFDAEIPVETSRLGDGLVVSRIAPHTVRLQIAAPRDIWESLTTDNFRIVVDLYAVGEGLHELPLETERSDSRIRIIAAEPDTVTVALEQRMEKEVPVRVDLAGSPLPGYRFQAPELLPDVVKVIGPASKVELVDAALVDVEIGNAQTTVNVTQRATPRDAQGEDVSGVQLDPPVVQVTVPIEVVTTYKDVPIRVRVEGRPASDYWISRYFTQPASATLVGSPEELDGIDFVFTELIRVDGATQTVATIVELERPPRIGFAGSNEVAVIIDVLPIMTSVEIEVAVTHVNLQPGMAVTVDPPTVSVTLSGPAPVLRTLQASSVIVSLNLSGVGPGTYALTPNASTPPEVTVDQIDPPQLRVVVSASPTPVPTPEPTPTPAPTEEPLPVTPTPSSEASVPLRR